MRDSGNSRFLCGLYFAVSAARGMHACVRACMCVRARAPADCTPVPRVCVRAHRRRRRCTRVCVGRRRKRRGEARRGNERLEPQIPFVRASSAAATRDSASSPSFSPLLSLSLAPPFLLSPPSTSAPDIRVSLTLSFPRAFLLRFLSSASRRIRALLRLCHIPPSRPSARFSRPLSPFRLCHSIAVLSRVSPTQGRPEGGMSRGPVKGARKG